MSFRIPFSPPLDGGLVNIDDGTTKKRSVVIDVGEYATPFWFRTGTGLVLPVTELPFQTVLDDGQGEVLSMPPQALDAGTIAASAGDGVVTISQGTPPSGGFGAYTRNLYRSTSSGTKGSLLSGDVSLPFADDTVVNGTTYWYTLEVVDSLTSDDTPQAGATPQAGGGGGGLTHPNEPVGFTQIFDQPYDTRLQGGVWHVNTGDSRYDIFSDPTAPVSPNNVGRTLFPEGSAPTGGSPVEIRYDWFAVTKFYLHVYVKLSSNWENPPGGGGLKAFWVTSGPSSNGPGRNSNYLLYSGNGAIEPGIRWAAQGVVEASGRGVSYNLGPNVGGSFNVQLDTWYGYEVWMDVTGGSATAGTHKLKLWVDGVLRMDYNDLSLLQPENDHLDNFMWPGTYGGQGPVPHDQWMYWDHVFASGVAA